MGFMEIEYSDRMTLRWNIAVVSCFFVCLIFWIYLLAFSEMLIVYDATMFESRGWHIYQYGLRSYFEEGPSGEPVYALIISFSIRIAEHFGVDYRFVQSCIQVLLLFMSQISIFYLLWRMQVKKPIILVVTLYVGVSPALINATFSLYSEIVAIGFVPLCIVLSSRAWKFIHDEKWLATIMVSVGAGIAILIVAMTKGVFEYVAYLIVLPFFFLALRSWYFKKIDLTAKSVVAGLIIFVLVGGGVHSVKFINHQLNGEYSLRCCRNNLLFATTYRRTENINKNSYFEKLGYKTETNMIWPQLAYVLGGGFCDRLFTEEECAYFTHINVSYYAYELIEQKLKGIPLKSRDKEILNLAVQNVRSNPLQYAAITLLEAPQMLLWETTKGGFVKHPVWLAQLYSSPFRLVLRGAVSIATIVAVFYILVNVFKRQRFDVKSERLKEKRAILMFSIVTVFSTIGLYSIFTIALRNALPIAPLYALCFAVLFSDRWNRNYKSTKQH
jgi:hypothetical protein